MIPFDSKQYQSICDASAMLAACSSHAQLVRASIYAARSLIDAEFCAYGEIDIRRRRAATLADDPRAQDSTLADQWSRLTLSSPVRERWAALEPLQAAKFSDHVDARTLDALDIYQHYYRPLGVRHQLMGVFSISGGRISSIGLNRASRDFDERDRALLSGLLRVLHAADQRLLALEANPVLVSTSAELVFRHGLLLSSSGAILCSTPGAHGWMDERYFGPVRPYSRELPRRLAEWVEAVLSAPPQPLVARRWAPTGVTTTLLRDHAGELRLELIRRTPMEPELLKLVLGATPRQAEVACWLLRGKSNLEIARRMGIAANTVKKHLEMLYLCLEVRASAGGGHNTRERAIVEIRRQLERYLISCPDALGRGLGGLERG